MAEAVTALSVEQTGPTGGQAQALRLVDAGTNGIMCQVEVSGKAREMRRVIVTLRLDGYEPTNKVAIAAVQNRIIAAVTKLGATVERKYPNVPQLALTVTPQAMAELRGSADVVSIHEDVPQPPSR